ncbi:MAG: T9SS C-terminal target domain-containing protein, partial [Bacteroidetes bacterium]
NRRAAGARMRLVAPFLLPWLMAISLEAQVFYVDTILYRGSPDTFINMVVLGDGYLESQMEEFSTHADSIISALFRLTPFRNYRRYFNAFSIHVPSGQQGAAMHPDSLIDNYFGSTFNYAGIERLLVPVRESRIISVLADNFPRYDQVIMLVNSPKYGGSGGWVCTASLHPDVNELVFHEMGHSFTGLADEYWAGAIFAWEAFNMTRETDPELVRWRNWNGFSGVGHYPHEEAPDWFRPHQECKMRYLGRPFCAVCTEATIERVHSLVSPVTAISPRERTIEKPDPLLQFHVGLILPEPNTLERSWHLNGTILDLDSDTCMLPAASLVPGNNLLEVIVVDTTSMLRVDAHETIHLASVSWTIVVSDTGSVHAKPFYDRASLEIFPNPTGGMLYINLSENKPGDWQAELYNLEGRMLVSPMPGTGEMWKMDLGNLPPGTYLLRICRNGTPVATRTVVRR